MKTTMFSVFFSVLFLFLQGQAQASAPTKFTFTSSETPWSFYGEGTGSYSNEALRLSCDWGEDETVYYQWHDLSAGVYKVTVQVRGEEIQKGKEGVSFWNFYDGGFGTLSPFQDLSGDYNWRKVEYTLKVKDHDLTVWFRLKSPGVAWIDNFSLEKVDSFNEKISIENPTENKISAVVKNSVNPKKVSAKKKLYTFQTSESGHPFSLKNGAGEFSPHRYYNFDVNKMPVKNWTGFDRLEMDVYNPNESFADFSVTIADDKTTNYWTQSNYKQTLAPGWNSLSLPLTQFVGERGSHRFQRGIDLSKLRKFFITIDPDSKVEFQSKNFLIDNITLSTNPEPTPPLGVMAFDFTSQKAAPSGGFTPVTSQTLYNDQRGFGFVNPKFWRIEDSKYASETLRYSIGLLDGHFKIKVPNGKYELSLIADKLGYWDVPFWKDRTILANGRPVFKESRNSAREFVSDLLRFENIVPEKNDHPYDLYLAKIFRPINFSVDVTNGFIDLEMNGDATGISLNSLILWNKKNEADGKTFIAAFEKHNKLEFDWMSRPIHLPTKNSEPSPAKLTAQVVEPDLYLNPNIIKKASASSLSFFGGAGESSYQVVQLTAGNSDEKVSFSFSDFTNEKGAKIGKNDIQVSDVVFQYTSPDINHESYLITGKYLKPIEDHSITVKKGQTKYLWLKIKLNDENKSGKFSGEFTVKAGSTSTVIPVVVTVLSYKLPKVDFPVGFFGLDPLPYSYFTGKGYSELRKKYRNLALQKLGESGFTTFTALPEATLKTDHGDFSLDTTDLDDLFKAAQKYGVTQTVFSYGGQFPQTLLDMSKKPPEMSEDVYLNKLSKVLAPLWAKKNWPRIVHTFSDEAGGYSDKMVSDIELGKKWQKYFPFMTLGGFGSFHGPDSIRLNNFFEYGFYSSLTRSDINNMKTKNLHWGFYNASAGNFDDPRYSFGLGLFIARSAGLSEYLEWNLVGFNNYPYYDFDGRESDVVIFYPNSDGKLFSSLRYELATEGLQVYRKLIVLQMAINNQSGNARDLNTAKLWLEGVRRDNNFYQSTTPLSNKSVNFREFEKNLDHYLSLLYLKP